MRLLKLSRIFILWKFKNLRSLEVKTSGSGLWLTPDPHHCITALYPLRTSCKCCHCLVFKIWLKYWEKINRPLHTPPHTHTMQGAHTHNTRCPHTHKQYTVSTHTHYTVSTNTHTHTHTTRCPQTHTNTTNINVPAMYLNNPWKNTFKLLLPIFKFIFPKKVSPLTKNRL